MRRRRCRRPTARRRSSPWTGIAKWRTESLRVRGLLQIATLAAGVYALLLAYLFFFQSRLIYFPNIPGRALIASPDEIGLPFQETNFAASDGVKLHGWYVPNGAQAPVVLFCHGNAGNISHRLEWLR